MGFRWLLSLIVGVLLVLVASVSAPPSVAEADTSQILFSAQYWCSHSDGQEPTAELRWQTGNPIDLGIHIDLATYGDVGPLGEYNLTLPISPDADGVYINAISGTYIDPQTDERLPFSEEVSARPDGSCSTSQQATGVPQSATYSWTTVVGCHENEQQTDIGVSHIFGREDQGEMPLLTSISRGSLSSAQSLATDGVALSLGWDSFTYVIDGELEGEAFTVTSRVPLPSSCYVAHTGTFSDDDGSVFEDAIERLAAAGITKGCNPPDNDKFCPDDDVTRGQMAVFLARAFGYWDDGGGDLFVDDDGEFYETAADRIKTAGVTFGCNPPDNDEYCGDDFVTRGQMAAFLVRALGLTDDGGGDLFTDDDGSIFETAIDRLGTAGITKGCNPPDNDEFCPDDFVTRGQMAAFLVRAGLTER